MDTQTFDSGDFWLLPEPESHIEIAAIALLSVISAGYLGLVVLMLFPDLLVSDRKLKSDTSLSSKSKKAGSLGSHNGESVVSGDKPAEHPKNHALGVEVMPNERVGPAMKAWKDRLRYELTSPYGLLHLYYNPILDLPKLLFQTVTLLTYLHDGFPITIICIYSCLLFINWMISCYRYSRERPDPHYVAARLFYSFDLFFAVFAPLEVLVYSRYNFVFDRAAYQTRVETLGAGSFDRVARLYADPAEVSTFRIAFHYLQFSSAPALFVKSALNVLSLFKWMRTIVHLVEHSRHRPRVSIAGPNDCSSVINARRRRYVQILFTSAIFFCAGVAVFVYSMVAIGSTRSVCGSYRQCVVRRYQWNVGAQQCSCIVFVDRSSTVSSFDEWENPPETTANLAVLASTGHLRIIQIINYAVPELPAELRNCLELEQLILIYTKTLRFPDWTKELTHLEYLHIEGDFTPKQLTSMPDDMFEDMHRLTFLHMGCLLKLPRVPDMKHLVRLRYLVLAVLHSVTELPSLDTLTNLRTFAIVDAVQVHELPSISNLHRLKFFALASRQPVCCNGFMTGLCDLSDFQCLKRVDEREVVCTTKRFLPSDFALANSVPGVVCEQNLTIDVQDSAPTVQLSDGACGGVMYKECSVNGQTGMCFSARMMVVTCLVPMEYQNMRRLQIARGVGDPCNPGIESWLGCSK